MAPSRDPPSICIVDARTCFFCMGAATFGPFDGTCVCKRCAMRIAEFVIGGDASRLAAVWSSAGHLTNAPSGGAWVVAEEAAANEVLRTFHRDVARVISSGEVKPHAQPAVAPDETCLHAGSLRGVTVAPKSSRETNITDVALRVLLTRPFLRPGGITELRRRIGTN